MTNASGTPTPEDDESDRAVADALAGYVGREYDKLENSATGDEMASWPRAERIASAQLLALQAIHLELRHGHDQTALQIEALNRHTETLAEHADAMDSLRHALDGHADAVSRMPRG